MLFNKAKKYSPSDKFDGSWYYWSLDYSPLGWSVRMCFFVGYESE